MHFFYMVAMEFGYGIENLSKDVISYFNLVDYLLLLWTFPS